MTQTLATRIKDRRVALGLSQAALAGRVEADRSLVGYWERGSRKPGRHILPVLADALEATAKWLATGEAPPPPGHLPSIPFHPLANLFPLMTGADFDALVDDMAANGFRDGEEIVLFEGKILDGRNRARAAIAAGIIKADAKITGSGNVYSIPDHFRVFGSEFSEWDNETETAIDPLGFVLAKNLRRRHLSTSQRAMVAAKIADLPPGRRQSNAQDCAISAETAARSLNVSRRSVVAARKVVQTAEPEVAQAVTDGQVSVASAADMATLPPETQREIIAAADPKVLNKVVAEARAQKTAEKKVRRAEREAGLATKIIAMPDQKFGVIYADPEWKHEVWSDEGQQKAASNHYPVSTLDDIKARLDAGFRTDIRADDCALFLWSTVPHMPQALEVMAAWGFEYKSQMVWVKDYPGKRQGMGYWFRINHEILLVGTRGNVPCPAQGENIGSVLAAAPGRHSGKPEQAAEMIEAYFPNLPKIELNARGARPGWTSVIHDPDAGQMVVGPRGEEARRADQDEKSPDGEIME